MIVRAGLIAATAVLCSCVKVPHHDGAADIRLDQVVKLLKCDLVRSIKEKIQEGAALDPKDNRFGFLAEWGAKVHLTISVDNTVSLNPGATLIEPLAAGTSRSLGLGAGVSTQAIAQKDIEFFLSFPELGREFSALQAEPGRATLSAKYNDCRPADGLLLESDLHLKAILDSALAPVADGTLTRGSHPGLASSPTANLAAAEASLNNFLRLTLAPAGANVAVDLNTLQPSILRKHQSVEKSRSKDDADKVVSDGIEAEKIEKQARAIIENIVTPLYEIAVASLPQCLADPNEHTRGINSNKNNAVVSAALLSAAKMDVDQAQTPTESERALKTETDRLKDTVGYAKAMIKLMDACAKKPAVKKPPPLYDPITTIGETINFYITSSGTFAPAARLVRVSAPLAPALVTGNRRDTNTLIISMGRPDIKDGKVAGPSAAMNQQVLSSQLQQAIINAPPRIDR